MVLASVRRQEEHSVKKIIQAVFYSRPKTIIGLFPRHMHRIQFWQNTLTQTGIRWFLRSKTKSKVPAGAVVLWDTIGELLHAYNLSRSAFVGGSLAPLGGQNFLEALACGVIPVIGPHWENFKWIGPGIIEKGLVRQVESWEQAADVLLRDIKSNFNRGAIQHAAQNYIRERQGGTAQACREILHYLEG